MMKEALVRGGVSPEKVASMSEKQLEAACKDRNIQIQSGLNNNANWGQVVDGFVGGNGQVHDPKQNWSDKKLKFYNKILDHFETSNNKKLASLVENMSEGEVKKLYKTIKKNGITLQGFEEMFSAKGADMTFARRSNDYKTAGEKSQPIITRLGNELGFSYDKVDESLGADVTFTPKTTNDTSPAKEYTLKPEDEARFEELRSIVAKDAAGGSGHIIPENMIKEYVVLERARKEAAGGDGYILSKTEVERYEFLDKLIKDAAKNIDSPEE